MLKNGIYEQIVNTRINKELQQFDREKYDIELEKLDGEDARRILTIYISYSSYMKDVLEAERKHLLVKKSDAETSFYYMGQFTVVEARNARKEDNRGRMQPITKVTMKMQHPVREDLLRYLQSNITA